MYQYNYLKKAKFWAQILGKFPGVRAIFLSGSLAQKKGNKNADIDFFIIARHGQIWTARFFIFIVLKIFCQLAKEKNHAGKICPNHFISDQNLEIQEQDAYAAHLFSNNQPLYDPDNLFSLFIKTNKHWMKTFGIIPTIPIDLIPIQSRNNHYKNWFESFLKKIQINKIKKNPEYYFPEAKIVLSDTELRFHPKPKNIDFKE